ncbi:MAG: hypothetical protein JXM70_14340 [Pirellulales bacterium]|nr:hypothetical protein [Pirellulales bacterium]
MVLDPNGGHDIAVNGMNSTMNHQLQEAIACTSEKAAGARGGKRKYGNKLWRHPFKRRILVPYRIAMAIAVMEMGISEYSVIARAVGLTAKEVERVDIADDTSVRQLALARIPAGVYFKLDHFVRCPKCLGDVRIAPCVACRSS